MKTLGEFIQRLQDDPAFEQRAQTFVEADELLAFVQREGYDFTLEQLANAFKNQAKLPAEAGAMAPAPTDVRASAPPGTVDAALPRMPEAFPPREQRAALPKTGNRDFIHEPPEVGLQEPKGEMPSQETSEKSPGELLRGGGGRHRGFSPQRLKSISVDDL